MERPLVCEHLTASLSGPEHLAEWVRVLLCHHRELRQEIEAIRLLLQAPGCLLLPVEARLRRLSRAVSMHLELEACFLDPALAGRGGTGESALRDLRLGYRDLQRLLRASADFLQREKMNRSSGRLSREQRTAIVQLLAQIDSRLQCEDRQYQRYGDEGEMESGDDAAAGWTAAASAMGG